MKITFYKINKQNNYTFCNATNQNDKLSVESEHLIKRLEIYNCRHYSSQTQLLQIAAHVSWLFLTIWGELRFICAALGTEDFTTRPTMMLQEKQVQNLIMFTRSKLSISC